MNEQGYDLYLFLYLYHDPRKTKKRILKEVNVVNTLLMESFPMGFT